MIVDAHNHIWDVPWPPLAPDILAGQVERFLHPKLFFKKEKFDQKK